MSIDPLSIFILLAILLILFLHSLFALASTSLLRSKEKKIEDEEFKVRLGRKTAIGFLQNSSRNILAAQVGRIICIAVVFLLFERFLIIESVLNISDYFYQVLLILLLATLIITISLVFIEIAWAIAYSDPEKSLCYIAPFIKPFLVLLYPFVYIGHTLSQKLIKKFALESSVEQQKGLSSEDISDIVEYESEDSELAEDELEMIKGVVDLSETLIEEIMTPRQDVEYLEDRLSLKEAIDILAKEEYSRLPVIGESLDDVKGIIFSRDLIKLIGQPLDDIKLKDFIRKVIFISGKENLLTLLSKFRSESSHFAVVLDEHGGVDGIVTMEDLLEEIVGDIFDEYDNPLEEQEYVETLSGDLLVDGGALIDDINNEYDLSIPEGEYDTIAGFIIDTAGKIPSLGEIVQYNGYKMIVEDVSDNRINHVRIKISA